ncbi:MAG: MATE family efflux transporter [Lachnospiraceae bacterium]|nr:MATE family efflux transporter [Lachnospiraceae bacterium]
MQDNSNSENKRKENKMGTMPVNKLLITMALPMMLSMLVQACYNIVDSWYLSQVSEDCLTAVSLAFAVQMLTVSFAGGLGVGINALLSKSLGEKNFKSANRAAMNGLLIAMCGAIIFLIFGLFFCEAYFRAQTDVENIVSEGTSYLSICMIFSFCMIAQMILERLLQSTGKTFYSMITQMVGAITNIILDPIFIFGYFGLPAMGTAGAAIATVAGQFLAACLALFFNLKYNKEIQLHLSGMRLHFDTIKKILGVGVPAMIMQSVGSVMNFGMNQILLTFSETATAVFGVYFKLNSFIFMPVFGMNNAIVPILAYNFGARNKKRMTKTMKLGLLYAFSIMTAGMLIFQFVPHKLLGIFNASENMLAIGVPALRTISLSFVLASVCIILISSFQALGNGHYSLVISVIRQLLVLLPVAYFFSRTGNINLVWWAFPIAEVVALLLSFVYFMRLYRKKIKPLELPLQE